ncbi:MAG: prepilin-type N-terminal cleavage/methylation domain-containing protein [Nitrospirota bacterium]
MICHRKNPNGFTLVEVLIALAILSIGLLALAGLQVVVIKANAGSKNLTSAVILAEAKIEELKRNGFGSLTNGNFQDPNNPVNETGQAGGIFTRSWVIDNYFGSADMKQIIVTLTWTDSLGNHNIPVTTVFSRAVD